MVTGTMIDRPTTAPRITAAQWIPAAIPGSGGGPVGGPSAPVGCVSCTGPILPRRVLLTGIAPGELVDRGPEGVAGQPRDPAAVAEHDEGCQHEVEDPDAEALPMAEIRREHA